MFKISLVFLWKTLYAMEMLLVENNSLKFYSHQWTTMCAPFVKLQTSLVVFLFPPGISKVTVVEANKILWRKPSKSTSASLYKMYFMSIKVRTSYDIPWANPILKEVDIQTISWTFNVHLRFAASSIYIQVLLHKIFKFLIACC